MPTDRHYIHELPSGQYRDATEEEIAHALKVQQKRESLQQKIKNAEAELKELNKDCAHIVCYDTAGHPYDVRHCVSCGGTSLI